MQPSACGVERPLARVDEGIFIDGGERRCTLYGGAVSDKRSSSLLHPLLITLRDISRRAKRLHRRLRGGVDNRARVARDGLESGALLCHLGNARVVEADCDRPDASNLSVGRHRVDDAKSNFGRAGGARQTAAQGIVRITRQPFLTGVGLWALVHLIGKRRCCVPGLFRDLGHRHSRWHRIDRCKASTASLERSNALIYLDD